MTLPDNGSNPVYDIVYAFKLLFTTRGSNSLESTAYSHKILSKIRSIFSNDATAEVFVYLCLHGAATAWIIQCQLEKPESTTYRALKHLRSLEVIVPALKTSRTRNSKGGPRPIIWALEGATAEEVARALRLHNRLMSPKYRLAEEVAQSILDEYITPRQITEITLREIVITVKDLKLPFNAPDIADLAARYLQDKGIKVWR